MFIMLPGTALLPDTWAAPNLAGVNPVPPPRHIPGGTKAPELGMMAEDYDRIRFTEEQDGGDWFYQVKVDGWRAIYLGGNPRIVTREGEPLRAADAMLETLHAIEQAYGEPMMFDGEFAAPGGLEATQAIAQSGRVDHQAVLWLFDAIPLSAWMTGSYDKMGAWERVKRLASVAATVTRPNVGVLLPHPVGRRSDRTFDQSVMAAAEHVWRQGGEGIVLKRCDSAYERRRLDEWLKVKRSDEITVTIDAVSAAGTLICSTRQRPDYGFGVAAGIDSNLKARFLSSPEAWRGVEIEIACSGYTGKGTPRSARFLRVKGEA